MSNPQLADVARWCNRYPDIELQHSLPGGHRVAAGSKVTVHVDLQRAQQGELPPVDASRYDCVFELAVKFAQLGLWACLCACKWSLHEAWTSMQCFEELPGFERAESRHALAIVGQSAAP